MTVMMMVLIYQKWLFWDLSLFASPSSFSVLNIPKTANSSALRFLSSFYFSSSFHNSSKTIQTVRSDFSLPFQFSYLFGSWENNEKPKKKR